MESSTAPAAGWFPDPGNPSSERWWSGHDWTDHTRAPLGAEVPQAFAAVVDTMVAERPEPHESESFVFSMTPSAAEPEPAPGVGTAPSEEPAYRSWYTASEQAAAEHPAPAATAPAFAAPEAPVAPVAPAAFPEAPAAMPAFSFAPEAPAAPAAAPGGFVMPGTASTPPAPAAELFVPTPEPVLAMPAMPEAAPVPPVMPQPAPLPTTAAPAPAFAAMPEIAPQPAPFLAPATMPAAAQAPGFVMPGATAVLAPTPAEEAARTGRHADALPEPPKPVAAAPAPRPVGYTQSADPDVANRYRSVIHAADQAPVVEEAAPAWPTPASTAMMSSPRTTSAASPAYASYRTQVNRPAKAALTFGLLSLFAAVGSVATWVVGLPGLFALVPLLLGLLVVPFGIVAVIVGIVGLVVARRADSGKGAALGGLLLGLLFTVIIPAAATALVLLYAPSLVTQFS